MIAAEKLKTILAGFGNKRVLVVGDYYLDEYVHTESDRFSPEAPIPRATITSKVLIPGAAGNIAAGLLALGAKVDAIGLLGQDEAGRSVASTLAGQGAATKGLIASRERITGKFSRILLSGSGRPPQHVIRIDEENTQAPGAADRKRLHAALRKAMKGCDAVIVADYDETDGTGVVDGELLRIVARERPRKALAVGMSRLRIGRFTGFDLVITNLPETEDATGIAITDNKSLLAAARALRGALKAKTALVTLSKEGTLCLDGKGARRLPSYARNIVDVCGAGDSLSVAFTLSLLAGATKEQAMGIGGLAAAVAVSKAGTATVTRDEIRKEAGAQDGSARKYLQPVELLPLLDKARKEGKRIIFTNGYFDLLHAGHICLLKEARKLGDILVVAINSDESTRLNKGANRPLIGQDERAELLAAFSFVDYVTVFEEMTPINIIRMVRPDVLVKGSEHSKESVVGKDVVEGRGGRVVILPRKGPSAERIIEGLRGSKRALHEDLR